MPPLSSTQQISNEHSTLTEHGGGNGVVQVVSGDKSWQQKENLNESQFRLGIVLLELVDALDYLAGKDKKNFEKNVKQYMKLLKGKRLKSIIPTGNHLSLVLWVSKRLEAFEFARIGLFSVLSRTVTFDRCDVQSEDCNRYPSGLSV
ncbi:20622_t:CDS:2 [Funneliformis geosporum]|nr:20622_t:CDS:2 [Funneliformis geosporum]